MVVMPRLSRKQILVILAGGIVGAISLSTVSVYLLLCKLYNDIKPKVPSPEMLTEQQANIHKNALFNLFPFLKSKIAWISLGDYPSAVDTMSIRLPKSDKQMCILLKREDLASSLYGGNKVRTLEYQLACAKLQLQGMNHANARMVSVGGSGSNQIVAASVYCNQHNIPLLQYAFDGECDSYDNGLNFVSSMSFPHSFSRPFWSLSAMRKLRYFYATVLSARYNNIMAPPGGANVTGALGHVNAVLELVKQCCEGNDNGNGNTLKAPKQIFLPLGSCCTTSGLLAGLALIRKLNIGHDLWDTRIYAVGIHHVMHSMIGRWLIKFQVRKLSHDVLALIKDLGGPDATAELKEVYTRVTFVTRYAGKYGEWTTKGLLAKQVMMQGKIVASDGKEYAAAASASKRIPWMCSCFSSKAFAAMIDFMEEKLSKDGMFSDVAHACECMLWCTKSVVQPLLNVQAARENLDKVSNEYQEVSEWLEQCHIKKEADYLPVMTRMNRIE